MTVGGVARSAAVCSVVSDWAAAAEPAPPPHVHNVRLGVSASTYEGIAGRRRPVQVWAATVKRCVQPSSIPDDFLAFSLYYSCSLLEVVRP